MCCGGNQTYFLLLLPTSHMLTPPLLFESYRASQKFIYHGVPCAIPTSLSLPNVPTPVKLHSSFSSLIIENTFFHLACQLKLHIDTTMDCLSLMPLEIRQEIYSLCLDDERPQPGLLQLNKSIHSEATQVLQEWKQTYSYNISAHGAGFDDSARWRFKVKGHTPRFSQMKHIIVNIEPPRLKVPLEMWNIWHYVQRFCKDLAAEGKIQRLTINFIETPTKKWETNGVPHSSWDYGCFDNGIDGFDIGQLLIIFALFVTDVAKPKLSIPGTYMLDFRDSFGETWIGRIEKDMTGLYKEDELVRFCYELIEEDLQTAWSEVQEVTGDRSIDVFRELFGSMAILTFQDLKRFKEEWPCLDDPEWLTDFKRIFGH